MKYRADIDGLRAFAVIAVILFHFNLGLPGGFIGVDVFFVISGFLITSIIIKDLSSSKFSFLNFWSRRIRRILPASIFVIISSLILGYFILDPNSYVATSESAFYHAFMCSNFYFLDQIEDYFALSSELQPLLHLWSLSVEEQFYLFFPLLLVALYKLRNKLFFSILIFTLFSFLLCIYLSFIYPNVGFYSLPSRAWELSAGSLLAIFLSKKNIIQGNSIIYSLSFITLLILFFILNKNYVFPGFVALLPVISTIFLILFVPEKSFFKSLLTNNLIVYLGKISFSLYLWHWPIIVFRNHILINPGIISSLACLFVSLILSIATYHFIENPFRYSNKLKTIKSSFLFGGSLTVLIVAIPLYIYLEDGLYDRFEPEMIDILNDINPSKSKYISDIPRGIKIGSINESIASSPDFVLWGDSHASVVAPFLDELAKKSNLSGIALISPGIAPVKNVWRASLNNDKIKKNKYLDLNNKRYEFILNSGIKNLILVARWEAYIEGYLKTEITREDLIHHVRITGNESIGIPNRSESAEALRVNLSGMLEDFRDNGIMVWIMNQVPSLEKSSNANDFFKFKYFSNLNSSYKNKGSSKERYLKGRDLTIRTLNSLYFENLNILDPIDCFYSGDEAFKLFNSRAFYRDEDHLTHNGVIYFLSPIFESLFEEIKFR